jgi:LuxR family maltose regulon positive regulatory protein
MLNPLALHADEDEDESIRLDLARLCIRALESDADVATAQRVILAKNIVPTKAAAFLENWPWPVRVYSLGQFSVHVNGQPLQFLGKAPKKQLELLKALAAFGGTEVSKERLAQALWPDAEGDDAQQALSTTLYRLRQLVGANTIIQSQGSLSLSSDQCWSDIHCVNYHLLQASKHIKQNKLIDAWSSTDKALALYHGPFSGYGSSPWELSVSERLRRRLLNHIDDLASRLVDKQYYGLAIQAYMKGIETDELQEGFYQGIIRCYKQVGRDAEAYSVYKQCQTVLASVLGCMPSAQTLALINNNSAQSDTSVPSMCSQ